MFFPTLLLGCFFFLSVYGVECVVSVEPGFMSVIAVAAADKQVMPVDAPDFELAAVGMQVM